MSSWSKYSHAVLGTTLPFDKRKWNLGASWLAASSILATAKTTHIVVEGILVVQRAAFVNSPEREEAVQELSWSYYFGS